MVFSSITFLYFFLPVVLLLYTIARTTPLRNMLLLLASLIFYCWGDGIYVLVLLLSSILNYFCGRQIIRNDQSAPSKVILLAGIVCNLFLLGSYKYTNFLAENLNAILAKLQLSAISLAPMHLPLGISFFTFKAISYLVDIYRKEVRPQNNVLSFALYMSLFPQLIAGPIVRYRQIAGELTARRENIPGFAAGAQRFIYGLAKKVLLANPLAAVADQIFGFPIADLSPVLAWLGAICYTLQIYFDFSGYSDMAIGLGKMFGFTFPENFNYPYISSSIREFWQRWHISLSTWLRDYLYFPLGGNRRGKLRTYYNLLVVFFLCGLWHGASWTFIVWGLYYGIFMVLERILTFDFFRKSLWRPLQHTLTMVIVIVGWVFFRSDSLAAACQYILAMFGLGAEVLRPYPLEMLVDNKCRFELITAVILATPIYPLLTGLRALPFKNASMEPLWYRAGCAAGHLSLMAILIYFTAISLAAGAYNPFIYFKF